MILIDTDHATFLKYPESERGRRFIERPFLGGTQLMDFGSFGVSH